MLVSKRTALFVSLLAILASWAYQLATLRNGHQLPSTFSEFAVAIAIKKLIVIAVIFALLELAGEGFDALGLTSKEWPRRLGVGLAIGTAMFLVFNVGLASVLGTMFPRAPTSGVSVMDYFQAPANLLLWLPISVFAGGVVEELQRIFVITRFEQWLGRAGLVLGVVLSSVMFGVGHLYQGVGIAIATGVSGAVLALVYLRRRSALEPIAAHAISDVFAVLAATLLAHPK